MDAASHDTYKKMRRGGKLFTVLSNIENINKLKLRVRSKRPILSASMCAFSFNIEEIQSLVKLCKNNHIYSLSVVEGWNYQTDLLSEENFIEKNIRLTQNSIRAGEYEANKSGVILRTHMPSRPNGEYEKINAIARIIKIIKPKACLNLYAVAWLLPSFEVIGCCSCKGSFGNITKENFKTIWNTKNYGHTKARITFKGQYPT